MKQVSVRTLVLLAELLAVVVVCQLLPVWTPSARAAMVWLDDEPIDPNAPDESENPQPESIAAVGSRVWLDDEPIDPNAPDEPENPQPEVSIGVSAIWRL